MQKGTSKTIEKVSKEQKVGFIGMLLGTLGTSLLGNQLTGKGATATSQGQGVIRVYDGTTRAGQSF